MDTPVPSPDARVKSPRARQFLRSPVLFASIQLSNLNGFILNASEGGLCVQTVREIPDEREVPLRFQSMRPHRWVEARARIAWKNESNTVAGLQFLNATPELLAEVAQWLSFGASLQELRGDWWPKDTVPEVTPPPETSALIDTETSPAGSREQIETPAKASASRAAFEKKGEPSPLSSPVMRMPPSITSPGRSYGAGSRGLGTVAGIGVLIFLAYFGWHEGFGKRPDVADSGKVASGAPAPAEVAPSATGIGSATTSLSAASAKPVKASESAAAGVPKDTAASLPPVNAGFVLQVAAMSEVENANNLAQALQEKQLPAFVSKKDADRFYRVLVGPYSDPSDLRQAQAALGAQGYESIEKTWSR